MSSICKALEVSRSNLSDKIKKSDSPIAKNKALQKEDEYLLSAIKSVLEERPSYGYRRVTALVRRGLNEIINHKRVYRVMRENDLLLQRYPKRPAKVHDGKIITLKSNMRWCSDLFGILCWNGDRVNVAFSKDCHDREIISWLAADGGIDGRMIQDLMLASVESRFGKVSRLPYRIQWLTDNGPQYVSKKTISFGRSLGLEICTTAPYSPESNGMAESFVKTFKRDYVAFGDLSSADRVMEQLPAWFEDYNEKAPHKSLKMLSPRQYRRKIAA